MFKPGVARSEATAAVATPPKGPARASGGAWAFAAGAAACLIPAQVLIGPAKAETIKTFDLVFNSYSTSTAAQPITGTITLDLDGLTDYPLGPIPAWVKAVSLTVTRSTSQDNNDYLGTFTLPHYSSFAWKSPSGGLDFTQELVGQSGWRTNCAVSTQVDCSFRIDTTEINPPTSGYPFQMYSRVVDPATGLGGMYYGLSSFKLSVATGTPAPLPLLGTGAALAWSRRLRARTRQGRRA